MSDRRRQRLPKDSTRRSHSPADPPQCSRQHHRDREEPRHSGRRQSSRLEDVDTEEAQHTREMRRSSPEIQEPSLPYREPANEPHPSSSQHRRGHGQLGHVGSLPSQQFNTPQGQPSYMQPLRNTTSTGLNDMSSITTTLPSVPSIVQTAQAHHTTSGSREPARTKKLDIWAEGNVGGFTSRHARMLRVMKHNNEVYPHNQLDIKEFRLKLSPVAPYTDEIVDQQWKKMVEDGRAVKDVREASRYWAEVNKEAFSLQRYMRSDMSTMVKRLIRTREDLLEHWHYGD